MHYMLSRLGKPSSFVLYKNAAHGHMAWQDEAHNYVVIDAFLRRHLKLPLPSDEAERALLRAEWHRAGRELLTGERTVEPNPGLAKELFELAAAAGHANAKWQLEQLRKGETGDGSHPAAEISE